MSLSLNGVSLSLGGRPLVRNLTLSLEPGEVIGLLGPNGAGKTTSFNLVIGLLRPDSGISHDSARRSKLLTKPALIGSTSM